jgi:hypothetical protein
LHSHPLFFKKKKKKRIISEKLKNWECEMTIFFITVIFKVFFIWKYIKIYIFYFLKFIFDISIPKQFNNK